MNMNQLPTHNTLYTHFLIPSFLPSATTVVTLLHCYTDTLITLTTFIHSPIIMMMIFPSFPFISVHPFPCSISFHLPLHHNSVLSLIYILFASNNISLATLSLLTAHHPTLTAHTQHHKQLRASLYLNTCTSPQHLICH